MYINDWLYKRELLTPDMVALLDTLHHNAPITYRQWNRAANRTANFLQQRLGVQKGDRVAVLAMNSVEYLDLWFACAKVGAIIHLLNWRLTPHELAGLIADATPIALVYDPDCAAQVAALRSQVPSVQHFVALGEAQGDIAFVERDQHPDSPPPDVEVTWNDPWAICYTGGTTGLPKGAILTYRAITANSVNTVMSWGLTPDDVAILNMPLFHTGGFNVWTAPLVHIGGRSIVCRTFDVDQTFDLLRDYGVTLFVGVPTMHIMLQQHRRWAEADFSRLRVCGSGGASCPLPVIEKYAERGVTLFTGYGLTEAGPNTFWLPKELRLRKPGSVGFPLMHIDVKIVDDKGRECGAEEVGELLVRGPHVCAGYWHKPEETARAITPEGWLHTGDLARRDAEGCYYIVGRLKDMFKSGGESVYPPEVESVLHGHPAVAEAAIISVPDARWGEVGRAFVVIKPGLSLTAEELLAFCQDRLARFKIPKAIVFLASLPKTAVGKVDKALLAQQYGSS